MKIFATTPHDYGLFVENTEDSTQRIVELQYRTPSWQFFTWATLSPEARCGVNDRRIVDLKNLYKRRGPKPQASIGCRCS